MLHGIMFHHFHDSGVHIPCQGSIDEALFSDLLDFYSKENDIVSTEEFEWELKHNNWHKNKVCLTFDDMLKCQNDIAWKVMQDRNLTGYFNINSLPLEGGIMKLEEYHHFRFYEYKTIEDFYEDFFVLLEKYKQELEIEGGYLDAFDYDTFKPNSPFYTYEDKKFRYLRDLILGEDKYDILMQKMMDEHNYKIEDHRNNLWMSKADIIELNENGNIIGLHTHDHPTTLETLTYDEQLCEFEKNQEVLKGIGIKPYTASYPCNAYNGDTLQIMKDLNVTYAFVANMTTAEKRSDLEIARQNHTYILNAMSA